MLPWPPSCRDYRLWWRLRLLALLQAGAVTVRILRHLRLLAEVSEPRPARTPEGLCAGAPSSAMTAEGMSPSVSASGMEEARCSLAWFETQMERTPFGEREMVERKLRPQVHQLERLLAGDRLQFAIDVRDVRVNTGPLATR